MNFSEFIKEFCFPGPNLEKENFKLYEINRDLQRTIEKLEEENFELKKDNSDLKDEFSELEKTLENLKNENSELDNFNDNKKKLEEENSEHLKYLQLSKEVMLAFAISSFETKPPNSVFQRMELLFKYLQDKDIQELLNESFLIKLEEEKDIIKNSYQKENQILQNKLAQLQRTFNLVVKALDKVDLQVMLAAKNAIVEWKCAIAE